MTMYLIAIHHPNDYDPFAAEDEAMVRDIDVLNDEMVDAGVRVFVGGLQPISKAKSLRLQVNGEVLVSDGHYLNTTEHIGGFWVLQVANLDEALMWGRKAAIACRAHAEVRAFN
ncbi:MAG: YciI family protein [Pseudomonadota bacterium]